MRRRWPFTLRGTGALLLTAAAFVIAERAGIPELLYFATLLVALLAASAIALLLTRGTGSVSRVVTPETPVVGGSAAVVVRAGLASALPTGPGSRGDRGDEGIGDIEHHRSVPAIRPPMATAIS